MSQTCNTCSKPISWDSKKREELGIRGPLNPDKSVHKCYAVMKTVEEKPPSRPHMEDPKPTEIAGLTAAILELAAAIRNSAGYMRARE